MIFHSALHYTLSILRWLEEMIVNQISTLKERIEQENPVKLGCAVE